MGLLTLSLLLLMFFGLYRLYKRAVRKNYRDEFLTTIGGFLLVGLVGWLYNLLVDKLDILNGEIWAWLKTLLKKCFSG